MKTSKQTLNLAVMMVLAVSALAGCGDAEEETAGAAAGDPYASAIPSAAMLSLSADDDATGQGLTLEQAAVGEGSAIHARSEQLRTRLNQLREATSARIDELVATGTMTEQSVGRLTCRRWEKDGERAHWRLQVCEVEGRAERFSFVLRGRPLDAGEDAFLPVFAGQGARLPDVEGARRGAGQVGYNFDNIAALTGEAVSGKLGIGYRAAGRARQLHLGLKDVQGPGMEEAHTGRYAFRHIRGAGGSFRFVAPEDVVALDGAGAPIRGEDGTDERLRAGIVWSRDGRARSAAVVCGGTLGQACLHSASCWERTGTLTFEEESGEVITPSWDATACPSAEELPEDIAQPPSEDETTLPSDAEGETGAPMMTEPAASQQE